MTIRTSVRAQYNPNTGKASYDAGASRQQTIRTVCQDCLDPTPAAIKVILDGIVWCPGLNNCCTNTRDKVTSYGVGWNGEFILSQGRVLLSFVREMPPIPCWWSTIHWGDYGSAIKYNAINCDEGVDFIYNFIAQKVEVLVRPDLIQVESDLGYLQPGSGIIWSRQIFRKQRFPGGLPFSGCFDYGEVYNNERICPGDCWGDGTAVISACPP